MNSWKIRIGEGGWEGGETQRQGVKKERTDLHDRSLGTTTNFKEPTGDLRKIMWPTSILDEFDDRIGLGKKTPFGVSVRLESDPFVLVRLVPSRLFRTSVRNSYSPSWDRLPFFFESVCEPFAGPSSVKSWLHPHPPCTVPFHLCVPLSTRQEKHFTYSVVTLSSVSLSFRIDCV